MAKVELTVPQVGLIAATRGFLGAGIGLLIADRLNSGERRAAGWALTLVGVITTVPLVLQVMSSRRAEMPDGGRPDPVPLETRDDEPAPLVGTG